MEAFEIGSCFKSYNELMQKLNEYCEGTCTKFTTKDSRLITGEFAAAKESFVYSELKLICVYGRTNKFKEQNRKRKMRTIKIPKTECPAYFRIKLINSGVALQIVAMNKNHNHPLEKIEEESEVPKVKKKKGGIKKEIKSEDDASSDDMQPPEYIELYIDPDDPQDSKIKFKFSGLCVPVFNIFREDLSLKTGSVGKYAQYLWDNGVRGVVVNHGAGEGMSITVAERKLVAEEWVTVAKNLKMHIMIQVGACPLPDAIELAKHAESLEADSILSIPELYFKPSTNEELVDYLKIISEAAPKTPLIYNHNPDVTGVELDMVEFIKTYASEIPTFSGLEYISHDIDKGESILDVNNGRYTIFFGVDSLVTSAFSLGFESAILPSANIYPKQVISMMKATKDSKTEARKLQKQLNTNCNIITNFGFWISSMKTAMNLISTVKVGICRPPLKNVSDEDMNAMKTKLELED